MHFLNENVWILIMISLNFVSKSPINNIPALVQIMAWLRLSHKSLSGPTRYVDGLPKMEVTPVTIWYIHPHLYGHTKVNIMVMNGWITSLCSMSSRQPIPKIRLFQTLTLKLGSQDHWFGQRARSYGWPSILLICFFFISHQSNQQFQR